MKMKMNSNEKELFKSCIQDFAEVINQSGSRFFAVTNNIGRCEDLIVKAPLYKTGIGFGFGNDVLDLFKIKDCYGKSLWEYIISICEHPSYVKYSDLLFPIKIDFSKVDKLFFKSGSFEEQIKLLCYIMKNKFFTYYDRDEKIESFKNLLNQCMEISRMRALGLPVESTINALKKSLAISVEKHNKMTDCILNKSFYDISRFKEKLEDLTKSIDDILAKAGFKVKAKKMQNCLYMDEEIVFKNAHNCNLNKDFSNHNRIVNMMDYQYRIGLVEVRWSFDEVDYAEAVKLNEVISHFLYNKLISCRPENNLFYAFFKHCSAAEDPKEQFLINQKGQSKNTLSLIVPINNLNAIGYNENDISNFIPKM